MWQCLGWTKLHNHITILGLDSLPWAVVTGNQATLCRNEKELVLSSSSAPKASKVRRGLFLKFQILPINKLHCNSNIGVNGTILRHRRLYNIPHLPPSPQPIHVTPASYSPLSPYFTCLLHFIVPYFFLFLFLTPKWEPSGPNLNICWIKELAT